MMSKVIEIGKQAALAAGAVLRQNYLQPHRITLKGVIDPVTETDLQAQEIIVAMIRQRFPEHAFLAEERLGEGDGGERPAPAGLAWEEDPPAGRWIIDPLDGTVNFAHGFPMFCVSIAFEMDRQVHYGVIYDPLRDELFEAQKGQGAKLNGQPIRVSGTSRLDRALIATGFPYDIRERVAPTLTRLGRVLAQAQGLRRAGSAALDLCYLACGRFDGFYEEHLKPWDTAAGWLLVVEAGGRLSSFSGGPYELTAPDLVASNGLLHDELLKIVQLK